MASGITTAFWGMTINNYDDTDLAMVQNGYPDYFREFVYTLERGKEGTPHIQAWIKLQRQQRLSFVKKLFPRGHFKPLSSDVYIANTKQYAQKLDGTAESAAVHRFNDPMNTIESLMKKVIIRIIEEYGEDDETELDVARRHVERDMVKEDYKNAKIFVSATYKQMWKQFGHEMYECLFLQHTHTHTHKEKIFSQEITIPTQDGERDDASRSSHSSDDGEDEEGSDFQGSEDSSDEGYSEGSDADSDEEGYESEGGD